MNAFWCRWWRCSSANRHPKLICPPFLISHLTISRHIHNLRDTEFMLDVTAFPHILDRVLDLAELPSLIRLRATCRTLRERVDRGIFDHVVLEWDNEGTELAITSGTTPHIRLPILVSSKSAFNRFRRFQRALRGAPNPEVAGSYDLKVHLPSLDPLAHTRTIDVLDHSLPIEGWPHFSPPPLPPLPSLIRTRACYPVLSPHTVLYLNVRAPPAQSNLRGLSGRNELTTSLKLGFDLTMHVFFDRTWGYDMIDELIWIACGTAKSVTLVLHPPKAATEPIPLLDGLDGLVRGLLDWETSVSRDGPFTVVGLETVPPELLGLSATLSYAEVEGRVRERPLYADLINFVSLAEWTRASNPLDVDVPAYMIKEVARTTMWSAVMIDQAVEDRL